MEMTSQVSSKIRRGFWSRLGGRAVAILAWFSRRVGRPYGAARYTSYSTWNHYFPNLHPDDFHGGVHMNAAETVDEAHW